MHIGSYSQFRRFKTGWTRSFPLDYVRFIFGVHFLALFPTLTPNKLPNVFLLLKLFVKYTSLLIREARL